MDRENELPVSKYILGAEVEISATASKLSEIVIKYSLKAVSPKPIFETKQIVEILNDTFYLLSWDLFRIYILIQLFFYLKNVPVRFQIVAVLVPCQLRVRKRFSTKNFLKTFQMTGPENSLNETINKTVSNQKLLFYPNIIDN